METAAAARCGQGHRQRVGSRAGDVHRIVQPLAGLVPAEHHPAAAIGIDRHESDAFRGPVGAAPVDGVAGVVCHPLAAEVVVLGLDGRAGGHGGGLVRLAGERQRPEGRTVDAIVRAEEQVGASSGDRGWIRTVHARVEVLHHAWAGVVAHPQFVAVNAITGAEEQLAVNAGEVVGHTALGAGVDVGHHLRARSGAVADPQLAPVGVVAGAEEQPGADGGQVRGRGTTVVGPDVLHEGRSRVSVVCQQRCRCLSRGCRGCCCSKHRNRRQ